MQPPTSAPAARAATFFFFNDTATTEIYTLSLHDALPIWISALFQADRPCHDHRLHGYSPAQALGKGDGGRSRREGGSHVSTRDSACWRRVERSFELLHRSEEHTSELQSHSDLVCRLLLEK